MQAPCLAMLAVCLVATGLMLQGCGSEPAPAPTPAPTLAPTLAPPPAPLPACSGTEGSDYCCPWPGSQSQCAEKKCNQIEKIEPGLWTVLVTIKKKPPVFFGGLYQRMIILELDAGVGGHSSKSLVLVNGAALDAALIKDLRSLEQEEGATIRYVLTTGDMHHVWLGDYNVAFPEAIVYVPPGRIPGLRKDDLNFTVLNIESPLAELRPHLHFQNMDGLVQPWNVSLPPRNELFVYHQPTKTLIAGDLFFVYACESELDESIHAPPGTSAGNISIWYEKNRPAHPSLWGDEPEEIEAAKKSAQALLELDFKRFIPIHGVLGNVVPADANPTAKALMDSALKGPYGILGSTGSNVREQFVM